MKISIISPETARNDQIKLLKESLDLIEKQIRSNKRYAVKIRNTMNKLEQISNRYNVQI